MGKYDQGEFIKHKKNQFELIIPDQYLKIEEGLTGRSDRPKLTVRKEYS